MEFAFRAYDPRLARFKSRDPLAAKYPYFSSYQFAGNSPIRFIDLEGAEPFDPMGMQMHYYYMGQIAEKNGEDPVKYVQQQTRLMAKAQIAGAAVGIASVAAISYATSALIWAANPVNQQIAVNVGEVAATLIDPNPNADYPGNLDDVVRGAKGFFKLGAKGLETQGGLKLMGLRNYKVGLQTSVEHFFKHTADDLSKPLQGVFDMQGSALVEMVDNEFAAAKSLSWDPSKTIETIGNVTRTVGKNAINYTIEMGKRIGYQGGAKGTGKALTTLQIGVTHSDELITTFPK